MKTKKLYSDILFPQAVEIASEFDKISTHLLQHRFRIGYARAARLINELEEAEIVRHEDGKSVTVIKENISKDKINNYLNRFDTTRKYILTKLTVYAVYYSVVVIFFILLVLLVTLFLKNIWITLIIIIFSFFIGLYLLDGRNYVLNILLPKGIKKQIDFFFPRWMNREFDEFVGDEIIDLYEDSNFLFSKLKALDRISDYSFALLPLVKAYEGILKKILIRIDLVREEDLKVNPHLTVNRFFNAENNKEIINKLKDRVRDKTIPMVIFSTYHDCRNRFLHYDPYAANKLTKEDAETSTSRILDSIKKAYDTFIVK